MALRHFLRLAELTMELGSWRFQAALRSIDLNQSSWLRYHPVEKLILLGELESRGLAFTEDDNVKKDQAHSLPHPIRMQIGVSLLAWITAYKNMQDAIARLRLPYAPTKRCSAIFTRDQGSPLVAATFPTRWLDRWVAPLTVVELIVDPAYNRTGEQVPPPHTWDPENSISREDVLLEETFYESLMTPHGLKGERETSLERLERVQERKIKLSSFDEGGIDYKRRRMGRSALLRRRRLRPGGAPLDSNRSMSPCSFQDAGDASYHGNELRSEGCPLTERGESDSVPIHVPLINCMEKTSADTESAIVTGCVTAHASILSSLYGEGRTVDFSSNNSTVIDYVQFVFKELCQLNFLRTTLTCDSRPPYLPVWVTQEALVLLPPEKSCYSIHEVENLCRCVFVSLQFSVESVPIVVEGLEAIGASHLSYVSLFRRRLEEIMALGNARKKIVWISANANGKRTPEQIIPSKEERKRIFNSNIQCFSAHKYSLQFLHVGHNSLYSENDLNSLVYHQLSSNTRVVTINMSIWNAILFYPQMQLLQHKLGNTFRYRAVQRSVLRQRLLAPRFLKSYNGSETGYPILTLSNDFLPSKGFRRRRRSILVSERIVDYLANSNFYSLLGLLSARLFGI